MSSANASYLLAQTYHLDECEQDLDELCALLERRPWSRLERAATERNLQVLIESCVGLAKHWVKQLTGRAHPEPRKAFELLVERGLAEQRVPWKKVIGLRNALVHDYLTVDADVLEEVVRNRYYRDLVEFGRQGLRALQAEAD